MGDRITGYTAAGTCSCRRLATSPSSVCWLTDRRPWAYSETPVPRPRRWSGAALGPALNLRLAAQPIVQDALSEILRGQDHALSENPDTVSRFQAFVRFHASFHGRESQAAKIVNHNLSSLSPRHYRRTVADRDRYERRFRAMLDAGVQEGVFNIPDTRITSYAILEMGMGIAIWFRPDGAISIDELTTRHEELALRMVGYEPYRSLRRSRARP